MNIEQALAEALRQEFADLFPADDPALIPWDEYALRILATEPMQAIARKVEEWDRYLAGKVVVVYDTPEAHDEAERDAAVGRAVERLTDAIAWVMEGGPDGEPTSVWNSNGYEAKGDSILAAIKAALGEDKP